MYLKSNYYRYIIKLITIILLAFAIPYNGYGQGDQDDPSDRPPRAQPFLIGLSSGINYSNMMYENTSTEFMFSGKISLDFEYPMLYINEYRRDFTFSTGISFDNKNLNINDANNNQKQSNITFLTIPIKYELLIGTNYSENKLRTSIVVGPSFSFLISNPFKVIKEKPLWLNVGIILGPKFEYVLNPELFMFIEYNYQIGLTKLYDIEALNAINSHIVNIGFKIPSTVLF